MISGQLDVVEAKTKWIVKKIWLWWRWFMDNPSFVLTTTPGNWQKRKHNTLLKRLSNRICFQMLPLLILRISEGIVALNSNRNIGSKHFVIESKKVYWSNLSCCLEPDLSNLGCGFVINFDKKTDELERNNSGRDCFWPNWWGHRRHCRTLVW